MDNFFSIIICAYNCQEYISRCIQSVMLQNYSDLEIICVNAASTDNTLDHLVDYNKTIGRRMLLFSMNNRKYQVENTFNAVKLARTNSICCELDGDDQLVDENVLLKLNHLYQDDNIWMAYSTYKHESGAPLPPNCHHRYPNDVIENNTYRQYPKQLFSHLRSWRRELFLKINEEDLKVNGEFAINAGDNFFAYPMLEMAGQHQHFIDEPLYIYNDLNVLNDYKTNPLQQLNLANYAKLLKPYKKLETLY